MFACERDLETEQRLHYIDPHSYSHQRCAFLVLLMLNRRPGGSAFCWVLAFSTASCHQPVSKTTGGPEGPFCWVVAFPTTSCLQLIWSPTLSGAPRVPSAGRWLSLPLLVSDFSGPQLHRGSQRPLLPGGGFPYHILSPTHLFSNSLISCPHRVI